MFSVRLRRSFVGGLRRRQSAASSNFNVARVRPEAPIDCPVVRVGVEVTIVLVWLASCACGGGVYELGDALVASRVVDEAACSSGMNVNPIDLRARDGKGGAKRQHGRAQLLSSRPLEWSRRRRQLVSLLEFRAAWLQLANWSSGGDGSLRDGRNGAAERDGPRPPTSPLTPLSGGGSEVALCGHLIPFEQNTPTRTRLRACACECLCL